MGNKSGTAEKQVLKHQDTTKVIPNPNPGIISFQNQTLRQRSLIPSRGAVISRRLHMTASLNACATHGQAHLRAYLGAQEQTSTNPNGTNSGVIAHYTSSITVCLLNPAAVYSDWKCTAYPDHSETCVVTVFFNGCGLISYVK